MFTTVNNQIQLLSWARGTTLRLLPHMWKVLKRFSSGSLPGDHGEQAVGFRACSSRGGKGRGPRGHWRRTAASCPRCSAAHISWNWTSHPGGAGPGIFYSFLESHFLTCSFPVMCLYSGRGGTAGMLSGHTEGEAALTRAMNARCQMNQLVLQRVLHVGY